MKRVLALVLSLIMVLSFAACGEEPDVRGEQIVNGTENANTTLDTTEANDDDVADTTAAAEDEKELALGAIDGLTYENAFIGIGCTLDSSWTFSTEEEIMALNNMGAELIAEEYQEALKNATVIYDMMATKDNMTDTIQVVLEKLNPLQIVALNVADNYNAVSDVLKQTYESAGGSDYKDEISKLTIDSETFDAMNVSVNINGVTIYQTILSIKCGSYLATITFTATEAAAISEIVEGFYLI